MGKSLTPGDISRYADCASIPVSDEALEAFADQFARQDEVLETLESLAPDDPPEREYWVPDEEDDPFGAFLARCDVDGGSGPLEGVTVGVKDNVAVAGMPMTCGSPVLEDYVPEFDATVIEHLLDAGARVAGKTNMDEFAFGGDESTMRYRLARNPRATDYQPGSSSAGSGVAAAAGIVDIAIGSDTGGSIRFPAAWSGVAGIKPTRGLVSHHGFVQYAKTLDNVGFLGQRLENLALGLDAVAGEDPRDERTSGARTGDYVTAVENGTSKDPKDLTIGVPEEIMGNAPDLDEVVRSALDELESAGATVVEVTIPDYEYWLPSWLAIGMTEVGNYFGANVINYWLFAEPWSSLSAALDRAFEESPEELGSTFVGAVLYAEHLSEAHGDRYYGLAHTGRERLTAGVNDALADVDVLASTTVPLLPPEWGEEIDDVFAALGNTAPFNVSGHPALSVPCGTVDDLPVGLQFVGNHFDEVSILRAAAHWESIANYELPELH